MGKSTALVDPKKVEQQLAEIDQVAKDASLERLASMPSKAHRAIALANGINALRNLVDGPILDSWLTLADTPLGFKTDRAPGSKDRNGKALTPYRREVIRDAIIDALLRGAEIIGNEFNVISGKYYLTKEYFERQLKEIGVEQLRVVEGVPQTMGSNGQGALVPMRASWVYAETEQSIDCIEENGQDNRIAVRVNSGMGTDAILGKAYRKLYARIHRRCTNSTWLAKEIDTVDGEVADLGKAYRKLAKEIDTVDGEVAEPSRLPTAPSIDWDRIEEQLGECEDLTAVNNLVEDLAEHMLDKEVATLKDYADWRRDQIRQGRGPRKDG